MIEKKLDVRTLLYSMMELEKLKLLLFDPDQYFLFQHLPKPILFDKFIYKNDPKKRNSGLFILSHMDGFWNRANQQYNVKQFQRSLQQIKGKEFNDLIDDRLIDMLDGFKT